MDVDVTEAVDELRRQTTAINNCDLTRAEVMLTAQAHALDSLFAQALRAQQPKGMHWITYNRLKAEHTRHLAASLMAMEDCYERYERERVRIE